MPTHTYALPVRRQTPGVNVPPAQRNSSTDPFAYDTASLVESIAGGYSSNRLAASSSSSTMRPITEAASTDDRASHSNRQSIASITSLSDRNKDLPPPPVSPSEPQPASSIAGSLTFQTSDVQGQGDASNAAHLKSQTSPMLGSNSSAQQHFSTQASPRLHDFVTAIHDYSSGLETCLSFSAGQVLRVLNRDPSGWWDGEYDNIRGWFPSNYVIPTSEMAAAMASSTTATNAPSRNSYSETSTSSNMSSAPMYRAATSPTSGTAVQCQPYKTFTFPRRSSLSPASGPLSPMTPMSANFGVTSPTVASNYSTSNRWPIPASAAAFRPTSPPLDNSGFAAPSEGITVAVINAISLLQNAVDNGRVSEFQAATSYMTLSVRSILVATDCLKRESKVLRAHLVLAKERKLILSSLASLASESGHASAENLTREARAQQTEKMMDMARNVLSSVEHFLQTAHGCGVYVPQSINDDIAVAAPVQAPHHASISSIGSTTGSSSDFQPLPGTSSGSESAASSRAPSMVATDSQLAAALVNNLQDVNTPNLEACLQFYPNNNEFADESSLHLFPAPSSGTTKALHKAKSLSDVKGYRRKMSEASAYSNATSASSASSGYSNKNYTTAPNSASSRHPSPPHLSKAMQASNSIAAAAMLRRPSIPVAYQTAALPSPVSWQGNGSISSINSSVISSNGPSTPVSASTPQSGSDIYRSLSIVHDQLLSTIAALIGHVHTHSRSAHSSSYARLIDMTRKAIDRVREALVIVEVVVQHPELRSAAKELRLVQRARKDMYLATTTLVTSVKRATMEMPTDLANEMAARDQEEEEKQELLHSATGVLRSSADCVNATRPLLLKNGFENVTFVLDFSQISGPSTSDTDQSPSSLVRSESSSRDMVSDEDVTMQLGLAATTENVENLIGGREDPAPLDSQAAIAILGRSANGLRQSGKGQQKLSEDHTAAQLNRVENWQRQQEIGKSGADSTESHSVPSSRRTSVSVNKSPNLSEENTERAQSSLSVRRGVPMPSTLQIQPPSRSGRHSRASSAGSVSATSTLTSVSRDKAASPAPAAVLRPILTSLISPQSATAPNSGASSPSDSYHKAGGEYMSRDESSRGSAASTVASSFRSNYSEANTADTSPRTSVILTSPTDEKIDSHSAAATAARRPTRPDMRRTRSGSTPDRLTALRISEASALQPLPTPTSARPPMLVSPNEASSSPKPWVLERDYEKRECAFNADGNVTGGSLKCLIERMTLHDQTIDPNFSNTFFLTFRMFTEPLTLMHALFDRFNIPPPSKQELTDAEYKVWNDQKLVPVRLRVYNFFKTWLESHWRPESDNVILEPLLNFARDTMSVSMAPAAQRLVDLTTKRSLLSSSGGSGRPRGLTRVASTEKLKAGKPVFDGQQLASATFPGPGSSLPPAPIVSKSLYSTLRSPPYAPSSIIEIDPLELARQFTIMESRLYCAIQPEELIGSESGKIGGNKESTIKMMSSLSTRLTGWIAEIILNEEDTKKRTYLLKYFIKLGDRCLGLQNFNTLMAVLAALNSSTIARLRRTWDGLATKYKIILENLRRVTEHSRNYAEYRATIRAAVAPCLPFLGLYLTDITFCRDGNPAYRTSPHDPELKLINFDRYQKIAKIVGDLQRFQQHYNLIEVPEINAYLSKALASVEHGGDVHALYRRSLMVEPRQNAAEQSTYSASGGKEFFGFLL